MRRESSGARVARHRWARRIISRRCDRGARECHNSACPWCAKRSPPATSVARHSLVRYVLVFVEERLVSHPV
eukprot:scaffold45633_cov85-Phaeocystis_antarctica.AAC.4